MDHGEFYETVLDNLPDGIYILDDKGNYLFANSTYIRMIKMTKEEILAYNVYSLKETNQISVCISDIVYREKRRIVMFQDVIITGRTNYRQLVVSNPIFDQNGRVRNIVAICKPLDTLDDYYHEAGASGVVSAFTSGSPRTEAFSVVAESPAMQEVLAMARAVADVDTAVLISGESGTGKEVVAQCIHRSGRRAPNPIIAVNCASLPENLLEAELFGYEKGAFTGAAPGGKQGLFEAAAGGTLFLDEINSFSLALQGKLLRAIETKTIQRIGSTKYKKVDFRLISATNENLSGMVDEKRFRADLFYRLNIIPLTVPPLRERREDILPLAMHFIRHYCDKYNKRRSFTPHTIQCMLEYCWPGNVRELKNFVERSVVMSTGELIEIENIEPIAASGNWKTGKPPLSAEAVNEQRYQRLLEKGITLKEYLEQCEQEYIRYALNKCKNSYAAADALGTSQSSVMRRKKKYGC